MKVCAGNEQSPLMALGMWGAAGHTDSVPGDKSWKGRPSEKNWLCMYQSLIFCSCLWQGVSLPSQVTPSQLLPCLIPSPFPPPVQRTTTLKPHKALQLFSHIIKLSWVILAGGLSYSAAGIALKHRRDLITGIPVQISCSTKASVMFPGLRKASHREETFLVL